MSKWRLCVARDVCKCPPEYMGDRCQYPFCRPPCINDGHCVRPNVCMCPASWKGENCQKPVCHLPCLNGGRCARPNQCTCLSGYAGVMCEKAICNQPCLNGGQCVRPGLRMSFWIHWTAMRGERHVVRQQKTLKLKEQPWTLAVLLSNRPELMMVLLIHIIINSYRDRSEIFLEIIIPNRKRDSTILNYNQGLASSSYFY
ncbi:hypothetical protein OS493_032696 [Desmophyllum pertusum]|uniref:EGF-like domain-containing protein n=1 Tax=Desmophyllum pertusum TaxID=174260 RepID=A0A9W9ZY85_9CNID|nr:hypothetical protein OS493_032696 [Desmophyllum pertusum]